VHRWTLQISAVLLAALLLTPELALAMTGQQPDPASPPPPSGEPANQDQGKNAAQPSNTTALPDAPSTQSTAATRNQNTNDRNNDNSPQQAPEGTAAAQAAKTKGGAASKPAGAAIAPAKQRRTRSLLIKMGVIAGAGAAVGSVYALTHASPARPPGAH
jgi:hypothetical protein